MLDFRYLEIEDRDWLKPLLAETGNMGSENGFGTLMIWPGDLRVKVCRFQDNVFLSFGEEQHTYYYPVAYSNLRNALEFLLQDADDKGIEFRMWGMTQGQVELMNDALPETFTYSLDLAGSDYIYSAQELIELRGRKFEKKRNHLSRFCRTYPYTYEDITLENLEHCFAVSEQWRDANMKHIGDSVDLEYCALRRAVASYEALGLLGGIIRVGGVPAAFTIGEEINSEVFLIHFEKALDQYEGIYTAINHEFAAHNLAKYKYINREEDMGIEGLRKAKLSYRPVFLIEKYSAVLKEGVKTWV